MITNGTEPLTVTLSAPVSPTSPPPTLTPKVAGTWSVVGDSDVFTPVSTLEPCSRYALTVWARTSSTGHTALGRKQTIGLRVACPPTAGVQQALARLGYLGARLRPRYIVHIAPRAETRREAAEHAFHPPRGALVSDPSDAPPTQMGQLGTTTRGALEVYQADRGLEATGEPEQCHMGVAPLRRDRQPPRPQPYTWVTVSESLPETLEVHRGHRVVFTTPVNTGVPGAETEQGIFPIYSRYVSTTMSWRRRRRHQIRRARRAVGELLQRRRRRARLPARIVRVPAVQRLRRAADRSRAHCLRDARHRRHRRGNSESTRPTARASLLDRQRAFHPGHPMAGNRAEELVRARF